MSKMIIIIDRETRIPMFSIEQMLMMKETRECYLEYGIHGLYYCVLFGWKGSPYFSVVDENKRDEMVSEDVMSMQYYDPNEGKTITRPQWKHEKMYTSKLIVNAIKKIEEVTPSALIDDYNYFEKLRENIKEEASIEWDPDPTIKAKQATMQKVFLDNLEKLRASQLDILQQIEDMFKLNKLASINDFF